MQKSDKFEIEMCDGVICFEGNKVTYKSDSYSMSEDECTLTLSEIDSLMNYFSAVDEKQILIDSALSKLTDDEKRALKLI